MSFFNGYQRPAKRTCVPTDELIDLNFCLPIPSQLSSARVALVPFVPSLHVSQYLEGTADHPSLFTYLPYGPLNVNDLPGFYEWFETRIRGDSGTLMFAIIDRTKPSPSSHPDQGGAFAGVIAYLNTSLSNLSTEIGHLLILPEWQRTFLTTNAVGLLLMHALEVPGHGGYGLRRVQWQANEQNAPSVKAAKRLGFDMEGIIRWDRILPALVPPKPGVSAESREGDPLPSLPGRHTAMLSLCWDRYSKGDVEVLMNRGIDQSNEPAALNGVIQKMAFVNNYQAQAKETVASSVDGQPIDLNFCLPIPAELSSARVKLVPFVPSLHAKQYLEGVSRHPELYTYLGYGPFNATDPAPFYDWFETRMRSDPGTLLFAIIDRTSPSPKAYPEQGGAFAGVMAYLNTFPANLATEIGHIMILPKWQRTFLTTNAVGLMIMHALEVPRDSAPGTGQWGLRRVQWQANELNAPSRRLAKRMGFRMEGVFRWQWTLPETDPPKP
ncbi:hypothetical protein FRB99_006724, partial [Tulasnella sp. 403]